jgi:hypothetical protein
MTAILDFFSSAAGGAIFGPVISFAGKFVHAKWIRPAEVKSEIDLLTAKRNSATEQAGWEAFAASQKQENGVSLKELPKGVHPIVANIYVCVDAMSAAVRPAVTFMCFPLSIWVYSTLTDPAATAAQIDMAKEINFLANMVIFWWFGERYVARSRAPISLMPSK